jgi:hypothetical protein
MHKQVEFTLADPVFDPQRQISRKFFGCLERLISGIVRNDFRPNALFRTNARCKTAAHAGGPDRQTARMRPPVWS